MISNVTTLGYGPNARIITSGLAGYKTPLSFYGERNVDLEALTGEWENDLRVVDDYEASSTWTCVTKAPFAVTGEKRVERWLSPGEHLSGQVANYVHESLKEHVRFILKSTLCEALMRGFYALKTGEPDWRQIILEGEKHANELLGYFLKPGYFGWFVLTPDGENHKYSLRVDVFEPGV